MCVCFKRVGENAGLGRIRGEKLRSRGDEVGRAWGWMGHGRGRVAQKSDAFSGHGERMGRVWTRRCGRGVRWGVQRALAKQHGERKAMAVGTVLGVVTGCS